MTNFQDKTMFFGPARKGEWPWVPEVLTISESVAADIRTWPATEMQTDTSGTIRTLGGLPFVIGECQCAHYQERQWCLHVPVIA